MNNNDFIQKKLEEFDQLFADTLWQEHKPHHPYDGEHSQYLSCGEKVKAFLSEALEESKLQCKLESKITTFLESEIMEDQLVTDSAVMATPFNAIILGKNELRKQIRDYFNSEGRKK